MDRNFLAHHQRDAANVVLAALAYNPESVYAQALERACAGDTDQQALELLKPSLRPMAIQRGGPRPNGWDRPHPLGALPRGETGLKGGAAEFRGPRPPEDD